MTMTKTSRGVLLQPAMVRARELPFGLNLSVCAATDVYARPTVRGRSHGRCAVSDAPFGDQPRSPHTGRRAAPLRPVQSRSWPPAWFGAGKASRRDTRSAFRGVLGDGFGRRS